MASRKSASAKAKGAAPKKKAPAKKKAAPKKPAKGGLIPGTAEYKAAVLRGEIKE